MGEMIEKRPPVEMILAISRDLCKNHSCRALYIQV